MATILRPETTDAARRFRPPDAGALVQATVLECASRLAEELGCPDAILLRARAALLAARRGNSTRMPMDAFARYLNELAEATHCDHFGLLLGSRFHPGDLGAYGYILLNSPTIGHALKNGVRYMDFHQQGVTARIAYAAGGRIEVSYTASGLDPAHRRQDAECSLGSIQSVLSQAAGYNVRPLDVRFQHQAPDDVSFHSNFFRCPVSFAQEDNVISFPHDIMRKPIPKSDPRLLAILTRHVKSEMESLPNSKSQLEQIRWAIRHLLPKAALSLENVSSLCGVTKRTMQRRLAAKGTGFDDIVDQIRRGIFDEMLGSGKYSTREIAEALGFSDSSGLIKARRRWTAAKRKAKRATIGTRKQPVRMAS